MNLKTSFFSAAVLSALLFAAGCASKGGYKAARYQAGQQRYGAIRLTSDRTFYLCPTIDRIDPRCRKFLASDFTPWRHATDAFEVELKASGLRPVRPAFEFGPSFESLRAVVAERATQGENAVYFGTELLWISRNQWVVDAVLISPAGKVLFEKRGLCVEFGIKSDAQRVAHMAIRQILADPAFRAVLQ